MQKVGQNGQLLVFTKIYINLLLLRKYIKIYHFLGIRIHGTQVFYGNRVS